MPKRGRKRGIQAKSIRRVPPNNVESGSVPRELKNSKGRHPRCVKAKQEGPRGLRRIPAIVLKCYLKPRGWDWKIAGLRFSVLRPGKARAGYNLRCCEHIEG